MPCLKIPRKEMMLDDLAMNDESDFAKKEKSLPHTISSTAAKKLPLVSSSVSEDDDNETPELVKEEDGSVIICHSDKANSKEVVVAAEEEDSKENIFKRVSTEAKKVKSLGGGQLLQERHSSPPITRDSNENGTENPENCISNTVPDIPDITIQLSQITEGTDEESDSEDDSGNANVGTSQEFPQTQHNHDPATTTSFFKTASETLKFELQYTGVSTVTLLCYCMAHLSIYELLYAIVLELTENRIQNSNLLYLGLLMTGLVILRSTGFVWWFLGKRYRRARTEHQVRLEKGFYDAKFIDWIEDQDTLRTTVEIIGFYLCYISLSYFWGVFLLHFVNQGESILKFLPSVQYHERMMREMSVDDDDGHSDFLTAAAAANETTTCQDSSILDSGHQEEDYAYIYSHVAKMSYYNYIGTEENAALMTMPVLLMTYVAAVTLFIGGLSKLGFVFTDNW